MGERVRKCSGGGYIDLSTMYSLVKYQGRNPTMKDRNVKQVLLKGGH
jgi:hypothetical protein